VTLRSTFVGCDKFLLGNPHRQKKYRKIHEGFAIFAVEKAVSEIILP
jgi:hypothetical protein